MLDSKDQKGFTLIEVLMVIFIIGILSVLAINGYSEYRKSALLDLGAENLVSQINEMRSKTIYGDFGGERYEEISKALSEDSALVQPVEISDAKCYGISFKDDLASIFSQPFENEKEWKDVLIGWGYKGCIEPKTPIDVSLGEIKIEEVFLNEMNLTDFDLRFLPPKGDWELIANGSQVKNEGTLKIKIRYGETTENRYTRTLEIDLKSLKTKINAEDV